MQAISLIKKTIFVVLVSFGLFSLSLPSDAAYYWHNKTVCQGGKCWHTHYSKTCNAGGCHWRRWVHVYHR